MGRKLLLEKLRYLAFKSILSIKDEEEKRVTILALNLVRKKKAYVHKY